jgi:hypothetical protein
MLDWLLENCWCWTDCWRTVAVGLIAGKMLMLDWLLEDCCCWTNCWRNVDGLIAGGLLVLDWLLENCWCWPDWGGTGNVGLIAEGLSLLDWLLEDCFLKTQKSLTLIFAVQPTGVCVAELPPSRRDAQTKGDWIYSHRYHYRYNKLHYTELWWVAKMDNCITIWFYWATFAEFRLTKKCLAETLLCIFMCKYIL